LTDAGLSPETINKILSFIKIDGTDEVKISALKDLSIDNATFSEGIAELETVINYVKAFNVPEENYTIDLTVARGLDYYTGTVYETFLNDYKDIGSVCSGGRYEDLAGYYTTQNLPGVGVSIGLTRLFYQLKEAGFFEEDPSATLTQVIVLPMEDSFNEYSIEVANALRKEGIVTEVYFEKGRMGKKLNYANKLNIPYSLVIGAQEVCSQKVSLKNMKTGSQDLMTIEDALKTIRPLDIL